MGELESKILTVFRKLLEKRLAVHQIILFGSRARGTADPQSDLDVVVILEQGPDHPARDYVSDCAWEAGFEHGVVVVPIVFGRAEWETGPESNSLLAQAVREEGIAA